MARAGIRVWAGLAFVLALSGVDAAAAAASDVLATQPVFKPGDAWTFDEVQKRGANGYSDTRLDMRVEDVGSDSMVVGLKRDGAPGDYQDHTVGLDWSLRHLVDGREETMGRPFDFPLRRGETWVADYTDTDRHGLVSSRHHHQTYKVAGVEDVVTPAGTFHAVRVEMEGVVELHVDAVMGSTSGTAMADGQGAAMASHADVPAHSVYIRLHSVFDWSSEVRAAARTVEEEYDGQDVRQVQTTRTLVSFKPAS